jgi:predicted YcjX-like family ATPase
VKGAILGEDRVRSYYIGDVPLRMPPAEFWAERFFEPPQFRPPVVDPTGTKGLPHLNLDLILDNLIGNVV